MKCLYEEKSVSPQMTVTALPFFVLYAVECTYAGASIRRGRRRRQREVEKADYLSLSFLQETTADGLPNWP